MPAPSPTHRSSRLPTVGGPDESRLKRLALARRGELHEWVLVEERRGLPASFLDLRLERGPLAPAREPARQRPATDARRGGAGPAARRHAPRRLPHRERELGRHVDGQQ